ncbi:ligand-binding sensor domain-containing protein [Alteromonas aestuariivivens]|nr:ligand-binding sensor domain-containing diguanylate cyclase [Alteromonas aestuariivivens]
MLKKKFTSIVIKVLAGLALLLANASFAEQNIRFDRLSLVDGLSQESVLASFQDSDGYMWFGTQEGLNRFDGYHFTVYSYNDMRPDTLSSDWVYDINETQDGLLLIATRGGLNVFDKASQLFSNFRHDPNDTASLSNDNVRAIHKDQQGRIWLGTDAGLNKFNPASGQIQRIAMLGSLGEKANKIHAITEDIAGGLWIGSDGGVYRYDPVSNSLSVSPDEFARISGLQAGRTRSLMVDANQQLWVGTFGSGVAVINLSVATEPASEFSQPEDLAGLIVVDIFESRDKKVWLATDAGLFNWSPVSQQFEAIRHDPKDSYSLSGNKIASVMQDRGGVFWVGTYSGLNKWNIATANFAHYHVGDRVGEGLSHNHINTFWDAGEDQVWVGTYEGGLNLLDTKTGNAKVYLSDMANPEQSLQSDKVMALFSRNDNELWIGYRDKGLTRLNRQTGEFRHYRFSDSDPYSLGANGVTAFEHAEGDNFWVATFNGGLNMYDARNDRFIRYQNDPNDPQSLSSNKVLSVTRDSRGLLWVGTWDGGLNVFNPATETSFRLNHDPDVPNSLGSNVVWSVLEDSKGNMWVGTQGGGLNLLSASNRANHRYEFERFNRHYGLPSNVVYGVLEDQDGMLWMSTNRGMTKFDPSERSLLNYDSSHGLQGNEFNAGAYHKSREGRFYFGGTNGVTAYYPKDISPNSHVPPVVLTKFQRLNEIESLDALQRRQGRVEVSHKDYLIAFEFAGLDYASPSNNRYAYKLQGFDKDWIEARDIRKATYTNLPAGNYVFKVKASNNDGVWNHQGADVALTVLPAPWYSWWAYTIYSLLILGMIFWLYRSYQSKLTKEANYRHELELEVAKRTSELSEANKRLLNASVTDQLTGLHNRRYLNNIIEQQTSRVMRAFDKAKKAGKVSATEGPRLFFLMFDLDGFKPINDNFGHDAGDQVIMQVSDLLREVSRSADTVIRWGGDEFLLIGQIQSLREVEILSERLREAIANHGFDIGLKQKMYLSSSIGYSCFPYSHHCPEALTWEQVHLIADSALYMSKEAGRNCWTGLVQSNDEVPLSVMNTLTHHLQEGVDKRYIRVRQRSCLKSVATE